MAKKEQKQRKTLNISLQSKKFSKRINDLANKWDEEGENLSTEVCKSILLVDELNKSITFTNILNMYELVKKMVYLYYPTDSVEGERKVEELFSKIISIDTNTLSASMQTLSKEALNSQLNINSNVSNTPIVDNSKANNISNVTYENSNWNEEAIDEEIETNDDYIEEREEITEEEKIKEPVKPRVRQYIKEDTLKEEIKEEDSSDVDTASNIESDVDDETMEFLLFND